MYVSLLGRKQESVIPGVASLDCVRILNASAALGPVVAAARSDVFLRKYNTRYSDKRFNVWLMVLTEDIGRGSDGVLGSVNGRQVANSLRGQVVLKKI